MDSPLLTEMLLALLGFLCLLPVGRAWWRKERIDVFEPIYLSSAFFFLLFVIRGVYSTTVGSAFLSPPLDGATQRSLNLGLVYLLPCLGAFYAGYYGSSAETVSARLPKLSAEWSSSRLSALGPLLLLSGFAFTWAIMDKVGGFDTYLNSKQESLTMAGTSYLSLGAQLIPIVVTAAFTQWWSGRGDGHRLLLLVGIPATLFFGLISGSKMAVVGPILSVFVCNHYLRGRLKVWHVFGLVILLIFAFPFFNTYRHSNDFGSVLEETLASMRSGDIWVYLSSEAMARYYGIDSLVLVVRDTPKVMDFQFGATIAPLFVAWIPRVFWEAKPVVTFGKVFAETYMGDYFSGTGISASATMPGEAYVNFHVVGMIVVGYVLGWVPRVAYEWLIRRNGTAPAVFLYASIFALLVSAWESVIAGLLSYGIAYFALLWVIIRILSRRTAGSGEWLRAK